MATANHALEHGTFHSFAGRASLLVGSKWAFTTALLIIIFWGISGPYFHFFGATPSSGDSNSQHHSDTSPTMSSQP